MVPDLPEAKESLLEVAAFIQTYLEDDEEEEEKDVGEAEGKGGEGGVGGVGGVAGSLGAESQRAAHTTVGT